MPIFQNPSDPAPGVVSGEHAAQELASQSAGEYTDAVRSGSTPDQYQSNWEDVASQFHEQFPNVDIERAQQIYQQSRNISTRQGLLATPTAGGENVGRTALSYIPFGGVGQIGLNVRDRNSLERIRDNAATSEDYANVRDMQAHNDFLANRGTLRSAADTIGGSIGFGGEMALTGGVGRAVAAGIGRAIPLAARTSLGLGSRLATDALRFGAAGAATAALNPSRAGASVTERLIPNVAHDGQGGLLIGGDKGAGDAFMGYLDHQIEYWSEMSGGALLRGGGALFSRLPGATRAAAIASGLTARAISNPQLRQTLVHAGFSGGLGEMLEERAGEVARGVTGVSNNFGVTGHLAAGRIGQALDQLAVEGLAFGGMQAGAVAGSVAANRLQRTPGHIAMESLQAHGISAQHAQDMVLAATTAIVNGTAQVDDLPSGPLRDLGQHVSDIVHQDAQGPSPGQEASPTEQTGAQGAAEGSLEIQTAPAAETPAAETSVPNSTAPGSAEQNSATNAEAVPPSGKIYQSEAGNQVVSSLPDASQTAPAALQAAPTETTGQVAAQTATEAVAKPVAKPAGIEAKSLADLHEQIGAWREVQDKINEGKPTTEAERAIERPSIHDIATAAKLLPREARILHSRLVEGKTQEAIGEELGISKERIRQIEAKALSKMTEVKTSIDKINTGGKAKKGEANAKRVREFPASMEGSAFSPEEAKKDPAVRAAINRANSPLVGPELRAKLMEDAVNLILKEKFDAANKLLAKAGEVPLTAEDYRAISELSVGRVTEAKVEAAKAAQTKQPTKGAKGLSAKSELLSVASGSGTETAPRAVTADDIKAVSDISPHHAVLVKKMQASIMASTLPIAQRVSFLHSQLEIAKRMTPDFAEYAVVGTGNAVFFGDVRVLTESLARENPDIRKAMRQGKVIGGSYNTGTGRIQLDGATNTHSQTRLHGHEVLHAVVNAARKSGFDINTFDKAWRSEIADGQIGDYAASEVEEGLAELMGLYLSGEMSPEALWTNFPQSAEFLEGHGWIPLRPEGEASFQKPADIFQEAINSGPLHADVLKLHMSPQQMAMNKLAWATRLKNAAQDMFVYNLRPAVDLEKAARKSGYSSAIGMNVVSVLDRLQHADSHYADDMRNNGMATLQDGKWTRTGIPWEQVIAGLTDEHKELVDKKTGLWSKISALFTDEQPVTKFDQWATARDVVNEHEIGRTALEAATKKRDAGIADISLQSQANALTMKRATKSLRRLEKLDSSRKKANDVGFEQTRQEFEKINNRLKVARKLVDAEYDKAKEASRVRMTLVTPEQLQGFRDLLASTSPEFGNAAAPIADRLTKEVFNASLMARASPDIHLMTMEDAKRYIAEHPTYIEMSRVAEDDFDTRHEPGRNVQDLGKVHKREGGSSRQIMPPLVTAYNRYQKTASMVLEQIRRNAVVPILQMNLPGWSEQGDTQVRFEIENDGLKAEQLGRRLNMEKAEIDAFIAQIESMGASAQAYFTQKPWSASTPNLFWWKNEKGELVNFKILDRALYNLVTGQQGNGNAMIEMLRMAATVPFYPGGPRILPTMSKALKTGATTASVAFQINNTLNPMRDPMTFLSNTIDQTTAKDLPKMVGRVYKAELDGARGKTDDVLFQYFKQARGDATKMFPAKDIPNMGSSKIDLLKQWLNVGQAGELGPRFLEFTTRLRQLGYSEERINREIAEAREKPGYYQDPVPFGVMLEGANAASEVTGPFHKGGYATRELNSVVPFFQPPVAMLSKQIRNWRTNAKGAAIAMGIYLGFKLIHFLRYKDEDWYKELNAYDRFNNFIIPVGGKLRRISGAQGFPVPIGGTLTSLLERMYGQRPDLIGLLDQSLGAVAPPTPLPPGITTAWQLQGNQDWLGRPIVPVRDENLSAWEKAKQYQLPYAIRQLTGGRGEASLRGLGLAPAPEIGTPHRSVDEAFARLGDLEASRTLAMRQGRAFDKEAEFHYLQQITGSIRQISQQIRGEVRVDNRVVAGKPPADDIIAILRRRQAELGQLAARLR